MLASPTSRWSAGAVLLTVLILVASWFLLISPRRSDAASVRDQVTSAQSEAQSLQTQIAQLKTDFANLPKKKAELAAIKQQLPATGQIPQLVRNLQDYASAAGVSLDALTPGTPAIYSADGATATTTTAQAGSVIQVPLVLSVTGDYFEDALFVKSVQTKLKRVMLITAIATDASDQAATTSSDTTSTPAATATAATSTDSGVSLQLTTSVFVLVDETTTLKSVSDQAKQAASSATSPAANASALATAENNT